MKPKKAKLVLQSVEDIKKEWVSALKGKTKSSAGENVIVVTGLETIAKIFSKPRMEILQAIIAKKPKSIYELAKILDRDFKNVYSDVQFLNDVGLIELKETGDNRKGLKPIAKYSGVELDLAA